MCGSWVYGICQIQQAQHDYRIDLEYFELGLSRVRMKWEVAAGSSVVRVSARRIGANYGSRCSNQRANRDYIECDE